MYHKQVSDWTNEEMITCEPNRLSPGKTMEFESYLKIRLQELGVPSAHTLSLYQLQKLLSDTLEQRKTQEHTEATASNTEELIQKAEEANKIATEARDDAKSAKFYSVVAIIVAVIGIIFSIVN